ncbi:NAD+ synthase [Candidatus Woesearchaeota archaeon]|nr:NAD+ synthase [Candidatus Woesearchaeota archaeon]
MEEIYKKIIKNIKDYFKKNNIQKAVIGLSGGIDSAVSVRLVVDAIGKDNVFALMLPEKSLTKKENIKDAVESCKDLGIRYHIGYIDDFLDAFKKLKWKQNKNAMVNLKPRTRMCILYNYANAHNALVIGTSNKTELMLGYFTKHGDGAADIEVIGDLFKTEVVKLAEYLKIPKKIIKKTPTAELYPNQTDEDELGASYENMDNILKKLVKKQKIDGEDLLYKKIIKKIKSNEHKGKMPFIIKVF